METLRTRKILDYLKKKKSCSLKELMERFGVSSATIHRDVEGLARRDAVERVRGGIVFNEHATHSQPSDFQDRIVANRKAKIAIAQKAVRIISEGDIVFLDSSTTTYELALALIHAEFDHLSIVTNAIPIMHIFRKFPTHWAMIGLGGNFDPQLNSILGVSALEQLQSYNITKAFMSCFGVDDRNVTTNHERQAGILKRAMESAERRYLLADHTKLGRTGLYRFAAKASFDEIITD